MKKCGRLHLKKLPSSLVRTEQTPPPLLSADVIYERPLTLF